MLHHGRSFRLLTKGDPTADEVGHDPVGAVLPARLRAIVDYAVQLTSAPAQVSRADVSALRAHGLDDRAIVDLCQVVAYFNFVNRMADGLGVEPESPTSQRRA